MLFFTLPCAPPLRPTVPVAGHARRSNKGCTKRQSLPNCQHNGRIPPHDRPGSSGPGVILAERPGRNGRCKAGRQATGQRTKAYGSDTGNQQGRRTRTGKGTAGKRRAVGERKGCRKNKGRRKNKGYRKNKGRRKIERKKQACENAGLTTRPEGRTNS